MTATEFEAKILNVEPEKIRALLAEAGAEHVADRFQRRYVYDIPDRPRAGRGSSHGPARLFANASHSV
ncbi:hypothetical protein ACIG5E_30230 [Kitasatospora sp. NPDC053057]|uniref:hypothetical protein n=1 Tax=Kitasatospora sp. NPDC053057 TaxID=3364062 RepID=UPI0037C879B9